MPRRRFLIPVSLVVLTLGIFAVTLSHDFVLWDDDRNIYENPHLHADSSLEIAEFWKRPYIGLYIPVTYTAWALLTRASATTSSGELDAGEIVDPFLFHLANLLLHLASVAVVFILVYRLIPRRNLAAAALGAAVFALHPLQVEPVAWATGLKDVLSTFLGLLAILLYLRRPASADENDCPRPVPYIASLICFILALLAKPAIVTVPLLIALVETGLFRAPLRATLLRLSPFFLAALAVIASTIAIQDTPSLAFPPPEIALWKRPVVALDTLAFYISKVFAPVALAIDYGRTPDFALGLNTLLPLWLLPLLLAYLVYRLGGTHRRFFTVALAFSLIAVAPVSGLVTFAFQGVSTVADRYMYLPMVGVALAVAGALSLSPRAWHRYAAATVVLAFAATSFAQISHWKDSNALFMRALAVNPDSVISNYNLAKVLAHQGYVDEAVQLYTKAIELKPDFPLPYTNLAILHMGRHENAHAHVALKKAVALTPGDAVAHRTLGTNLLNLRRYPEAITHYQIALQIEPGEPKTMIDLAYALANNQQFEESIRRFNEAIALQPPHPAAYKGLGHVYLALGRHADAIETFQKLVALDRNDPWSHRTLSRAYADSGALGKARAASERALSLARETPDYPDDRLRDIEKNHARYHVNAPPADQ